MPQKRSSFLDDCDVTPKQGKLDSSSQTTRSTSNYQHLIISCGLTSVFGLILCFGASKFFFAISHIQSKKKNSKKQIATIFLRASKSFQKMEMWAFCVLSRIKLYMSTLDMSSVIPQPFRSHIFLFLVVPTIGFIFFTFFQFFKSLKNKFKRIRFAKFAKQFRCGGF